LRVFFNAANRHFGFHLVLPSLLSHSLPRDQTNAKLAWLNCRSRALTGTEFTPGRLNNKQIFTQLRPKSHIGD
jgi:hypothetical protein